MEINASLSVRFRDIDANSEAEIFLVASRMRQTLIEVLGQKKGTALYSMDWLIERVRWHLDPGKTTARICIVEDPQGQNIGHAIARIDRERDGSNFGYFSTVFTDSKYRKKGIASSLIQHVETWLKELGMPKIVYNTAENHLQLIRLFERHGYEISHREGDMVQLTKIFENCP